MGRITACSLLRQERFLHVDGVQMDRRVGALHSSHTFLHPLPGSADEKKILCYSLLHFPILPSNHGILHPLQNMSEDMFLCFSNDPGFTLD